jgi:hypothetical protein
MDLLTLIAGISCNALALIRFEACISMVFSSRHATLCFIPKKSLPLAVGLKLYALEAAVSLLMLVMARPSYVHAASRAVKALSLRLHCW